MIRFSVAWQAEKLFPFIKSRCLLLGRDGIGMVRINKVINNNMVSSLTEDGREVLLKGPGIGYGKRPGAVVDDSKVEQRFVLEDEALIRRFDELSIDIDARIIDVCVDIVSEIKASNAQPVNDSLYIMLIDHVYNLVERLGAGIAFDNTILWNLKQVYPEEHRLARRAVAMLQDRLTCEIDDSEANFITLHIVNAEMLNDMHQTYKLTKYIEDVRDIVSSNLGIEFDEDDYRVNRFLVHLKFLFEHIGNRSHSDLDIDAAFMDVIGEGYPEARRAVAKAAEYIEACTGYELCREERLYLLIHLVQIFKGGISRPEDG